jgi:hypothetical protein
MSHYFPIQLGATNMHAHPYKVLGAPTLMLFGAIALAGDGVNLRITNDSINDVFVTVRDMNTNPNVTVVDHQRINGFAKIPVSVSADATGRANISWTAIRVDDLDRRCGHAAQTGLDNDANVNVHADSDCAVGR